MSKHINNTEEYKRGLETIARKVSKRGVEFLEIGSHIGESASVLGHVVKQYAGTLTCVDPWVHEKFGKEFLRTMDKTGLFSNVVAVKAKSQDFLPFQPENSYDLIYIDGNHLYDIAKIDFVESLRLIKSGGIIAIHDCVGNFEDHDHNMMIRECNKPKVRFEDGWIHYGVNLLVEEFFGPIQNRFKELVYFTLEK